MSYYFDCWKKYATFEGRARRKEYWMFVLFNVIIEVLLYCLMFITPVLGIAYMVYALAVFIPSLAVIVRRLHDVGKGGVWILIAFIPLVGPIWLLILMLTEGTIGSNMYGEDPKAEEHGVRQSVQPPTNAYLQNQQNPRLAQDDDEKTTCHKPQNTENWNAGEPTEQPESQSIEAAAKDDVYVCARCGNLVKRGYEVCQQCGNITPESEQM